jgi:hypothetical protein
MKIPNEGSRWASITETFIVLHTIELNDRTWIHYRKESSNQEYSCYVESFLERFTEVHHETKVH